MISRRLSPIGLLLWAACSSAPPAGALLAKLDFATDTTARCVEVVVRTASGTEIRSRPVKTTRTQTVKVGIARGALPETVTVFALGFADDACLNPTVPPERSDDALGTFKAGTTTPVALRLTRRPNMIDADGDGYASIASGGDDCDDTDPGAHPGALEACGDGVDNDCDKAIDCAQGSCADQVCASGGGARCKATLCAEISCNDGLDNDRDGMKDCEDADCAGAACANGGHCMASTCQGATTEKDLCADGADNDGDGKIDCDDPDCLGSLCASTNLCLTGSTCDAAKSCTGGTAVVCATSDSCFQPGGTCVPSDGGCAFVAIPGKACDDLNGCTNPDSCSDAGVCSGPPIPCAPIAACLRSSGCSADAGCLFTPAVGDSCNDGNNCTRGDQCGADAGCTGTAVSCVPSACQQPSTQCAPDAGCLFDPFPAGTACDGGVCNAGGTCIPNFPYPPSNFVESQLPTPGGSASVNCAVTVDSHLSDGGVGFGGWCGNPAPPYQVISQPGGHDAVLVAFSTVDFAPDASVRLEGDRPVIFAATGSLSVQGQLFAAAGFSDCADGGFGDPQTGNKGGGGGGFGSVGGPGGNAGGAGGIVNGDPLLVPLRGGCPGGGGARGGGGLQLSAAGNLSITGIVAAPGNGGLGGQPVYNGGKAAGSGGGLLLEGLFVLTGPISAITANGGSGGEGSGLAFGGDNGAAGETGSANVAVGGDSLVTGAKGGDGAAGTTAATGGGDVGISGGGGGGAGVGRVRINSVTGCSLSGTGVVSPKATSNKSDAGC